jgi:phytoene dehydrogenase-like protein
MSSRVFDAVLIGGGHNGLVCAAYLAAAGMDVIVCERRGIVGGAAVTEAFHPGFRNSTASYTVSLLDPAVIRDLRLAEHGLSIVERPFSNFLPLSSTPGDYLKVGGGIEATQREVARFSRRDAEALPAYYAMLERVADMLRELMHRTPPELAPGRRDWASLVDAWKSLRSFRALSLPERRDVVDLFTKSAGEILDRRFESAPIKAAFGFDAVVGNFASPYAAGSAYVLLHHVFGEVNGRRGQWGHAKGGMGAITQAMAAECQARGVAIRTGASVARVVVKAGRACGVELESGEVIEAKRVVANVNPKLLFGTLVDAEHVDADFRERMAAFRCGSGTFRMNVALSALPDFACLPSEGAAVPHHASGIVVAPSLAYMERAFFDAKASGWSRAPIVEVLIPSVVDDSLAPPGMHVASLFCQHVHPDLAAVRPGATWDDARDEVADLMIATVDAMAPNFRASVVARRALTPLDLEREFGLVGGDIFHGALGLDQLYATRPTLGAARYRMPVRGLYLCGAGAHPGGGVTGIPGRNAAREILKDARRRR